MNKYKKIISSLFQPTIESRESIENDLKLKCIISIVLSVVSLALSIFNLVSYLGNPANNYSFLLMMITTLTLMVTFAVAAFLYGKVKIRTFPGILVTLCIAAVFSYYALSGQNEGFAILWIVLVPLISPLFISFKLGLGISIYFLLFVIVIFYTPLAPFLREHIEGFNVYYTNGVEFSRRFPALYAASFFISLFLTGQRLYYFNKSEENSLYDHLTGLKNRRFFSDYLTTLEGSPLDKDLTVVSIDMNNLKELNDEKGHDVGDRAIIEISLAIIKVFKPYTKEYFRTGGDEFEIFIHDKTSKVEDIITELRDEISKVNIKDVTLTIACGYVRSRDSFNSNIHELISMAENNMYKDKAQYKETHKVKGRAKRYRDFD